MTDLLARDVVLDEPDTATQRRWYIGVLRDPFLLLSMLWVAFVIVITAFGTLIAPHNTSQTHLSTALVKPFRSVDGVHYWLGTDELGRDYLSLLIVGARDSVLVGVLAALLATLIALVLGSVAGYFGGRADQVISRLIDLQLAFPALLFALLVLVSVGPSVVAVTIVLAIGAWASIARYVRGLALEIRQLPFIDAARGLGATQLRVILRHVIPNLLTEVAVLATLRVASLMLLAAGLDFLGLGLQPPATSWGILIANGRNDIQTAWWLTAFPGIALFLTALSINVVALWLRTMLDPEGRIAALVPKRKKRMRRMRSATLPSGASSRPLDSDSSPDEPGQVLPRPDKRLRGTPESASEPILEVDGLSVDFYATDGIGHAVRDVSWAAYAGEVLAVVGESGSGKSATIQAIMDVLPRPQGRISHGSIRLRGKELTSRSGRARRRIAGSQIAMVPQDAISALDPSMTVGAQLVETMRAHQPDLSKDEARRRALELFQQVGIPDPESRLDQYPHQFSGGMCQRVLIAMAISNRPTLLIADEPTTALDVTVQKAIMDLIISLKDELQMSVVLVTHDLGLVAERADRIVVMYAGRVMEQGPTAQVIASPANPYTASLLEATPRMDSTGAQLIPIAGTPPSATHLPSGCAFHPRCPSAFAECPQREPKLVLVRPEQASACHLSEKMPS